MADKTVPFLIGTKPGIKRDGTVFEGENYVDGQWVRWQRGFPRKMLGYRRLTKGVRGRVYGMDVFEQNNYAYTHFGGQNGTLDRIAFQQNGVATGVSDRTPSGLPASSNYLWQFSQMYNAGGTNTVIIAHPDLNLNDMLNSTGTGMYFGNITGTTALTALTGTDVPTSLTGGICVSGPYLFAFGDAGYITWSSPTQPTDFSTANGGGGPNGARVTAQKVLRGLPLRAGIGAAPAAIFWSTTSLIRASFNGGSTVFQFDTITTDITVLSSLSPVEYDGVYYWPGVDRFYKYTGVVDELDNQLNQDWFFNGLNMAQRQKVFAMKVPRFGEIWWCFPKDGATECTHAVIYNVRESKRFGFNVWYDTQLPPGYRTASAFAQLLGTPVVVDGTVYDGTATYPVWQNETGYDRVGDQTEAIDSWFETSDISLMLPPGGGEPSDQAIHVITAEMDFVQYGDMTISYTGRVNARSPIRYEELPFGPNTPLTYPKTENRIFRMKIRSNVAGGYYELGQTLLHIGAGTGSIQA